MKAIVFHGEHDLRVDEVREPECREGEAILEVKYAGICGSDLTIYKGKHTRAKAPTILGHEFSGIIVERKGSGHPHLKVGDRVAVDPSYACGQCELCRTGNPHICYQKGLYGVDSDGGFARFVRVSLQSPYRIPDWATFEEGVLVEPLAVAVRAVALSRIGCMEYALVLGAGPIGLLTAQVARASGAAKVLIVEPQEFRRTMAREMGFTVLTSDEATRERIAELTSGRGVDVVLDAAGVAPAARMSTALVKRTGRIVVVAVYKEPVLFDLTTLGYGENQVLGSCIYTATDFRHSVTLLEEKRVDLLPLVTHRLSLEEGIGAIDGLTKGMPAQKVLLSVG